MARITINLLTHNGAAYIPYLFDSLKKQTYTDWVLHVLDNASGDETLMALERAGEQTNISFVFDRSEENLGFAAGHNRLIDAVETPYVVVLNQDIYLESDCLERLAAVLDANMDIAAVTPRLMKWNAAFMQADSEEMRADLEQIFTDVVDSIGLKRFKSGRVMEWGSGLTWGQVRETLAQTDVVPMFGIPATCALYRTNALRAAALPNGDVLDSLYHSYKEDVDLSYRLNKKGHRSAVCIDAVAYHDRTSGTLPDASNAAAAKNKKTQPLFVRYHSYKNHLMTLYKNLSARDWLRDGLFIFWYEGKKFVWNLLFDRPVLAGWKEIGKCRKELKERRKHIVNV